ncbi:MAG TPA: hypothetical protein PLM22_04820 [Candidatus Sabulitectum sp.]|nr:hypothetical protein [Candidatus Sabulitectum sp.]HPR21952.1 hypothetical protein [Candidatus Sabulitectum sp.]
MTQYPLLVLTALVPMLHPVSTGGDHEFRTMYGLVPESGWECVQGIPFTPGEDFAEVICMHGPQRAFRVLSTGSTAGLKPSVGSWVTEDEYAGFLELSGIELRLWEFEAGKGAGFRWAGASLEARDLSGEDPHFFGEYSTETIQAAAGEEAFCAGVALRVWDGLRLGPAWLYHQGRSEPWVTARASMGPLELRTGGALEDSLSRRRISAALTAGPLLFQAGVDEDEFLARVAASLWECSLSVNPMEPGVHLMARPVPDVLASLSHREGGEFSAEVQLAILNRMFIAGAAARRDSRDRWTAGFMLGISRTP